MNKKTTGLIGAAVGTVMVASSFIPSGASATGHLREAKVVAAAWMLNNCSDSRIVNCYDKGIDAFIRQIPGSTKEVCVMYVHSPRDDYCVVNRPGDHEVVIDLPPVLPQEK